MSPRSLRDISDALSRYAKQYKVSKAFLFGSYARNEADAGSDIDLCIEYDDGFDLFMLGGLGKSLEEALQVPVDIVCGENSFYPRAKQRYLQDRVLVYERS